MAGEHLTASPSLIAQATFHYNMAGKEVFRITPDGVVIVQGDVYKAAKVFWEVVQELAPPGWKVIKE